MNFPALEITLERPDINWFFMTQVNLRLGNVPSLSQDMGIFSKCLAPRDQRGSVKYSWHIVMTTSYTLKLIICKLIKIESSNQKQCCGCRWCRCRARESSVSALNLQWNACNRPPPAGSGRGWTALSQIALWKINGHVWEISGNTFLLQPNPTLHLHLPHPQRSGSRCHGDPVFRLMYGCGSGIPGDSEELLCYSSLTNQSELRSLPLNLQNTSSVSVCSETTHNTKEFNSIHI